MAFDENVQERDCTVIFKFSGEYNICVTVIEVVQKLSCRVFYCRTNRRASHCYQEPIFLLNGT